MKATDVSVPLRGKGRDQPFWYLLGVMSESSCFRPLAGKR